MTIFDEIDLAAEAAKVKETKHYEQDIEPLDEPAGPISEDESKALDRATEPSFRPLVQDGDMRERANVFVPPTEWVSPVVKARRRSAMMLPSTKALNDLDARLADVTRWSGLPEDVNNGADDARRAIAAAREAYALAQHPDNARFAISQDAKDSVQVRIGEAVGAVAAVERMTQAESVRIAQFETLTKKIDGLRDVTLRDLRAIAKSYGDFRRAVEEAQAVALATGRWDVEWHRGVVPDHELNRPLAEIRKAIEWLEGDDDAASGRFLTNEYDGVPPHTLARLKLAADRSSGGSFARQVYVRAVQASPGDTDAQQAIATKQLITLTNSNPWSGDLIDRHAGDENGNF